ncbi:MAG: ArsR/SmtB family transcription factor [Nocardioidaceae bacterium]
MSLEVNRFRAIAHPLRLQMLSLLTGAAMSAAELARELDISQANASYHLRTLFAAGLVQDVGREKVRGGVAKRYRYVVDEGQGRDQRRGHHPEGVRLYAEAIAAELVRRSAYRRADSRTTSADADLWVEPQVWTEVCDRVVDVMRDLHAAAKPPRTEGTQRVSTSVMLFAMDDDR